MPTRSSSLLSSSLLSSAAGLALPPVSRTLLFLQPELTFTTAGGVEIYRQARLAAAGEIEALPALLDQRRGAIFSSGVDAPGRYRQRQIGFVDPPLVLTIRQQTLTLEALSPRGEVLMPLFAATAAAIAADPAAAVTLHPPVAADGSAALVMSCAASGYDGPEELRTRRPSVLSLLRRLMAPLASREDPVLGLCGAFGYDLAFALEDVPRHHPRPPDQRDLVLYLPDSLVLADPVSGLVQRLEYEFSFAGRSTRDIPRQPVPAAARRLAASPEADLPKSPVDACNDHGQGQYAGKVSQARQLFARGDLFELVLSQTMARPCSLPPSQLFDRLRRSNPAPYEALISLGEGENLVSASPEMFVRVSRPETPPAGGDDAPLLVETCPISGTIARGASAVADADAALTLLLSKKDHAELTMCTDVDRNDKARVCLPGSVHLAGRRMIETYSRLLHTVDHVRGTLRPDMDALDAFLTHTWAVTVTGAPKLHAMRQVEAMESSSRRWYGGAFGILRLDGTMDTGLTLRTVRLAGGVAEVRVGATLLADSDPDAEQQECLLKASALLAVLEDSPLPASSPVLTEGAAGPQAGAGAGKKVLLVDHEDSFVLTLADYLRQCGAEVLTCRPAAARALLRAQSGDRGAPCDMVVLSPGPGKPADFALAETLALAEARQLPVFGVCLGLQGMVEYFGGTLRQLAEPVHGKASTLRHSGKGLFAGLPPSLEVGRYHSLAADRLPPVLECQADCDGVVMAVAHRSLPFAAVQFHPESLLSAAGLGLLGNAFRMLCR